MVWRILFRPVLYNFFFFQILFKHTVCFTTESNFHSWYDVLCSAPLCSAYFSLQILFKDKVTRVITPILLTLYKHNDGQVLSARDIVYNYKDGQVASARDIVYNNYKTTMMGRFCLHVILCITTEMDRFCPHVIIYCV